MCPRNSAIRGFSGGDIFDPGAIALDAALGAAGVGIVSKVKTAFQLVRAGDGIRRARNFGAIGERAIGATGKQRTIPGVGRPDKIVGDVFQEAKNVSVIRSRDAAQINRFVQGSTNPVEVFTRPNTNVSRIQGLIDNGSVVHRSLPGINNRGVFSLTRGGAAATGGFTGSSTVKSLK